jgi:multiple sugar transport system permease protein
MTRRGRATAVLRPAGIAAAVGFSVAPFLWFAAISFETPIDVTATPPRLTLPATLEAYRSALVGHALYTPARNSLVVAAATTVVSVVFASGAAYALARLRLHGRKWILGAVLAAAMFPQIAGAGPVWRILGALGLLNSLAGLVLPHVALTLPLAIWILASFFKELPPELEEAARVDGCSRTGALVRVVAPLAAPGMFSAAILVFTYSWNEFFFALLILSDPDKHTLPLAIALFPGQYTMPWAEIAAASVVATLPLVAVVLAFQKRIVGGLAAGAVKG